MSIIHRIADLADGAAIWRRDRHLSAAVLSGTVLSLFDGAWTGLMVARTGYGLLPLLCLTQLKGEVWRGRIAFQVAYFQPPLLGVLHFSFACLAFC